MHLDNVFCFEAMANYELAADYYKGEESNRYALILVLLGC